MLPRVLAVVVKASHEVLRAGDCAVQAGSDQTDREQCQCALLLVWAGVCDRVRPESHRRARGGASWSNKLTMGSFRRCGEGRGDPAGRPYSPLMGLSTTRGWTGHAASVRRNDGATLFSVFPGVFCRSSPLLPGGGRVCLR